MRDSLDICPRCLEVVELAPDWRSVLHTCALEPVPWEELLPSEGVSYTRIEPDAPSQMGPFLPWDPPQPRLIADLILWTREELFALWGQRGSDTLAGWLRKQGYELRLRGSYSDKLVLLQVLRARHALLPAVQREAIDIRRLRPITSWLRLYARLARVEDAQRWQDDVVVPDYRRQFVLGFPRTEVAPGETCQLEIRAPSRLRVRQLVIDPRSVMQLMVTRFEVAKRSGIHDSVPASFFDGNIDGLFDEVMLIAEPNQTIDIALQNVSREPCNFTGAVRVEEATSDPVYGASVARARR